MKVVKIGGSIERTHQLLHCLNRLIERADDNLIFVPGGGAFAEQIRSAQTKWRFDDVAAHTMAILAMQQMGVMLHAIKQDLAPVHSVDEFCKSRLHSVNYVWLPDIRELNSAGVPASWDVTSDSLSAWLAERINADELMIVKAAVIPVDYNLSQLADLDIVDKAFTQFTKHARYKIRIITQEHL